MRTVLPPGLSAGEIDAAVKEVVGEGRALYSLDEALLAELEPDLIVTQAVCEVCAVSYDDVVAVAARLPGKPAVLQQDPSTLGEVLEDVTRLGAAADIEVEAAAVRRDLEDRLGGVRAAVAGEPRPRALALEWLDPPFLGGHWVPEMIELAGGEDVIGRAGEKSPQAAWRDLDGLDPEVVVAMPCGYYLDDSRPGTRASRTARCPRRPADLRRRRRLDLFPPRATPRRRSRAPRPPLPPRPGEAPDRDRVRRREWLLDTQMFLTVTWVDVRKASHAALIQGEIMKCLKLSALTFALAAVMALIGGGVASATEVYSGNTTLGVGTTSDVTLETGGTANFTDTAGNPIDTCKGTTGSGKALTAGSSTTTPTGIVEILLNEGCTQPTKTLTGGEGEIHHIAGTHNGTVTSKGTKVTISVFGVTCVYGTGLGTDLGILTGTTDTTKHAVIDVNAIVNEQEPKQFLCPDTGKWVAFYTVTSPTGINVRAS